MSTPAALNCAACGEARREADVMRAFIVADRVELYCAGCGLHTLTVQGRITGQRDLFPEGEAPTADPGVRADCGHTVPAAELVRFKNETSCRQCTPPVPADGMVADDAGHLCHVSELSVSGADYGAECPECVEARESEPPCSVLAAYDDERMATR